MRASPFVVVIVIVCLTERIWLDDLFRLSKQ